MFGKADLKFEPGVLLRRTVESNEYLFGPKDGVHTSRTAKRLPPSEQIDGNMIKSMIGVPWETKAEAPRGRPPKIDRQPPE
eukprot:11309865-Heterocapsa_arctica.AAC.1